jgi:hypothetical protein
MRVRCGHVILCGSLLGLTLVARNAPACSCAGASGAKTMREVAEWYSDGPNASKIIFENTVERQEAVAGAVRAPREAASTSTLDQHRVVSLRVLHSYRGEAAGTVRVLTGSGVGDCGFDFETGSQYLVYADKGDDENLVTSICTGTSLFAHANVALRTLRSEQPTPDDLLDGATYYKKFGPLWTGTACGRVTQADGTPFGQAWMDMTQVRGEPFAVNIAADSDQSRADGSFCIRYIRLGKYLLTAERLDVKDYVRWTAYYPGVAKHSQARLIEVHTGEDLADLHFSVGKVRVHTVLFHIVAADGSLLPLEKFGVSVDAPERDALAYHLTQTRNINGEFPAGYVPPGNYLVQAYVRPDRKTGGIAAELLRWRMARREMYIGSDSEIILKLSPVN